MTKKIKSPTVQTIPKTNIPYRNKWGHFVWTDNKSEKPLDWPGIKAPAWVKGAEYIEGKGWCWYG